MLIGFVCLVVSFMAGSALLWYSEQGYGDKIFASISGVILCVISGCAAILYACLIYSWISSDYQANIINREYGTNYTQAEVFYASDVIDTVRELDRKRIELNGNLLGGGK